MYSQKPPHEPVCTCADKFAWTNYSATATNLHKWIWLLYTCTIILKLSSGLNCKSCNGKYTIIYSSKIEFMPQNSAHVHRPLFMYLYVQCSRFRTRSDVLVSNFKNRKNHGPPVTRSLDVCPHNRQEDCGIRIGSSLDNTILEIVK